MALINVETFTGMRPAVAGHLLETGEAQSACNVDTSTGVLQPVFLAKQEAQYDFVARSVWRHDARISGHGFVWRAYPDKRQFVESPVAGDRHSRLYMSGGKGLCFMGGDGKEYVLGVTAPEDSPVTVDCTQRGGAVRFDPGRQGFVFTSAVRAERPYLTPGEKVTLTGTLPAPFVSGTAYTVLEAIPTADGAYAYRVGTGGQSVRFTEEGKGQCVVAYAGTSQNRVYVYTVVNVFGDESAPSLPCAVTVDRSCNLRIKNLLYTAQAGEAPIAGKRIYRLATGASGDSGYLYVDEIAGTETTFVDNRLDEELAEALPSLDWKVPGADLRHLTAMPGGVVAAHTEGSVRFSEPYMPYAWPEANSYDILGRVLTIAASQRTLFVLTESVVHSMTVDDPASVYTTTLDGFAPCLSPDGVVSSPLGVLFPSSDGLYLVSQGMTSPQNVTDGLISDREWSLMNPASFLAIFFDTTYMAFFRRESGEYGTLMLDFGRNGQARMRLMDEWGTAVQVVPGGRRVFYAKPIGSTGRSAVYELFGNRDAPSIATWRSKAFVFPTAVNMGAAIVECDTVRADGGCEDIVFWGGPVGEQMAGEVPFGEEDSDVYPGGQPVSAVLRVFADDTLRANLLVRPNRFMRLPQGYAARKWEFEITTLRAVRRIAIGTAIEELR